MVSRGEISRIEETVLPNINLQMLRIFPEYPEQYLCFTQLCDVLFTFHSYVMSCSPSTYLGMRYRISFANADVHLFTATVSLKFTVHENDVEDE